MNTQKPQSSSILIVDDEASLRQTFHFFLTREGYAPVRTATSLEEAMSIMASQEVDLIISDIVLEKSSGITLLKYARKNGIDCPFIVITGYPDVETAAESLRYGAFDYIVKPVEKQTLLRAVRLALNQRNLVRQRLEAEEERERYRVLLDTVFKSATDAIIVVDEQQTVLKLNEAARSMLAAYIPELDVGMRLDGGNVADKIGVLQEDLSTVLKTGEEVCEHRLELKDGEDRIRVLSLCTSPLLGNTDPAHGAVLVIRDMSLPEGYQSSQRSGFHRFIGSSKVMQTVYTMIENVGRFDITVLITGESGTGKELAAEALHQESPRNDHTLIKVDCTAIPENLLESELFGHKKGSFTGADKDRKGLLLQADGGTLLLDEIGEISPATQLRLLRFLQERTFYPVGSDTPIVVDTRVITATNVDLREKVQEGSFREDLYFRLKVIDIVLPPLRARREDIALLAGHFIRKYGDKIKKSVSGLSDNALAALQRYYWPGNVRELEHLIERAVVLCQGDTITTKELPQDLFHFAEEADLAPQAVAVDRTQSAPVSVGWYKPEYSPEPPADTVVSGRPNGQGGDAEIGVILATLRRCGGNKAKAARLLGIDRSTLYRKIRELDIDLSVIALE
jgi:two-component system response regulator HydG